jgi:hypothetical protein
MCEGFCQVNIRILALVQVDLNWGCWAQSESLVFFSPSDFIQLTFKHLSVAQTTFICFLILLSFLNSFLN